MNNCFQFAGWAKKTASWSVRNFVSFQISKMFREKKGGKKRKKKEKKKKNRKKKKNTVAASWAVNRKQLFFKGGLRAASF